MITDKDIKIAHDEFASAGGCLVGSYRAMEAALIKYEEWRLIETAPKDGTPFLALIGGIPYKARYDEHGIFIWYMHSNHANGASYRVHEINGVEMLEKTKDEEYDYRPTTMIWKRGFNDTPTHWKRLIMPKDVKEGEK